MTDSTTLPKIQSTPTLTQLAYQAIQQAILTLEFKPGELISAQNLSHQLGVSRTPIQNALLLLEQDGLVSILSNKGACVSRITAEDVEEILESRILLESYAARKAVNHLSSDELKQFEAILRKSEDLYSEGNAFEAATVSHQIHQLLLSKLDNCRLVGFVQQLDIQYTRIRLYSAHLMGRTQKSNKEHWLILEALKAGNAERASAIMSDHLSSVKEDILLSLLEKNQEQESLFGTGKKELS
jgi:DNA-binding GntR family transcriptional regulator